MNLIDAWEQYLQAEKRGVRKDYLAALRVFAECWKSSATDRDLWLRVHLPPFLNNHERIRQPLIDLLAPELLAQTRNGNREAADLLCALLIRERYNRVWGLLHPAGWRGVAGEILLLTQEPSLRAAMREEDLVYMQYTLHELPSGVLYGHDGATLAQCEELINWIARLEADMTLDERTRNAALLGVARRHYTLYASYLKSDEQSGGYAAFLAKRGEPPATTK